MTTSPRCWGSTCSCSKAADRRRFPGHLGPVSPMSCCESTKAERCMSSADATWPKLLSRCCSSSTTIAGSRPSFTAAAVLLLLQCHLPLQCYCSLNADAPPPRLLLRAGSAVTLLWSSTLGRPISTPPHPPEGQVSNSMTAWA